MAKYKRKKSEGKIAHKKTEVDGIIFDSKMESEYYIYLKAEKAAGRIIDFELQPVYVLQPKYINYNNKIYTEDHCKYKEIDKLRKKHNKDNPDNKIGIIQAIKYKADFKITYSDHTTKVIDVKGIKTADFKLKEKMFKFRYPEYTFECVIWDGPSKTWLEYSEYEAAKKARKAAKATNKTKKTTKKKK